MRPDRKKYHIAFPAVLAFCLLLFLLISGRYFANYLQAQIFEERTTQLNEITSQVRTNLDNALDSHWNYLTAAVNALEYKEFDTADGFIKDTEQLLETPGNRKYQLSKPRLKQPATLNLRRTSCHAPFQAPG